MKQIVQTRQHYVATIVIRKRLIQNQDSLIEQQNLNNSLLNITWFTSLCQDNQFSCGSRYEAKCYSSEQRCDGSLNKFKFNKKKNNKYMF